MGPTKRAAAAPVSSHSKRRRFVTSCSECHRRKQKCNREKPCNFCCSRNVPDLCTYASIHSPSGASQETFSNAQQTPDQDGSGGEAVATTASITEQVGYSQARNRSYHSALHKYVQRAESQMRQNASASNSKVYENLQKAYAHLVKQLPSKTICDELVEVYLDEVNWYYQSLEKYYFLEMYHDWMARGEFFAKTEGIRDLSRDLQYFPALLCQVLANATLFAPPDCQCTSLLGLDKFERRDSLSREYADRGADIMTLLGLSNPTIVAVQYEMLRAEWLKNSSRGTDGWHCLSVAVRLAQEIGLHVQTDVVQDPELPMAENLKRMWYEEYRRRLWAKVFIIDSHTAVLLGRPRMIHRDDCDTKPLLDCDIPEDPSKFVPMSGLVQNEPPLHPLHLCLHTLAHKIHDMLSPEIRKPLTLQYDKVQAIHRDVQKMLDDLPPHMRPKNPDTSWDQRKPAFPKARMHILSSANVFLVNLHRPHVSSQPASRKGAFEAALTALYAQQQLFLLLDEHHYHAYGVWFPTIDTGLFLSSMIIDQPPQDPNVNSQVHVAFQQAISRLGKLKSRSSAARTGEQILKQCYQRIQEVIGPASPSMLPMGKDSENTPVASYGTPSGTRQQFERRSAGSITSNDEYSDADFAQLDLLPEFLDLSSIPAPQDLGNDYLSVLLDTGGSSFQNPTSSTIPNGMFDTNMATQLSVNGYVLPPDYSNFPVNESS